MTPVYRAGTLGRPSPENAIGHQFAKAGEGHTKLATLYICVLGLD